MVPSLEQMLSVHHVMCAAECTSKKRLLEIVSSLLSSGTGGLDENLLCESFNARERLGSTGIGEGIAIPHCRLAECRQASAALITLRQPIDFSSIDDGPVDIAFALVVPDEATEEHLQMLGTLAGLFSQRDFCDSLRACNSATELHTRMLSAWSESARAQ